MKRAEIKNLAKMVDNLKNMGNIEDADAKNVLIPHAEMLKSTMQSLVRVDSGRLRNAIKVMREADTNYKKTVVVGVDFTPDGKGTMTIAALAYINEYGTSPVRKSKKGTLLRFKDEGGNWVSAYEVSGLPAKPYIRPALDMTQDRLSKGITGDLVKMINKKAKKYNLKQ
jgi:hypothetical protein